MTDTTIKTNDKGGGPVNGGWAADGDDGFGFGHIGGGGVFWRAESNNGSGSGSCDSGAIWDFNNTMEWPGIQGENGTGYGVDNGKTMTNNGTGE